MANDTYRRTADLPQASTTEYREFIVRRRTPTVPFIVAAFLLIALSLMAAGSFIEEIGGMTVYIISVALIIGVAAWFVITLVQSNRDLVLMTEFQNAIFSSVANLHNLFLLIVKPNGNITYYSENYPKLFAEAKRHGLSSLESLLQSDAISQEDALTLRNAMENEESAVVFATLTDIEGKPHDVRLILRPLPRPRDFFVITCAPMRRRSTDSENRNQLNLFDRPAEGAALAAGGPSLAAFPVGLCLFSTDGMARYIHPDIEEWLGYQPGSIVGQKITLQDLIYRSGDASHQSERISAYEGDIIFKKQSGSLGRAYVVQTETSDAYGGGYSTIILPVDRHNPFRHMSGSLAQEGDNESYLNDLLNNAPIGIAVMDKDGNIIRYNEHFGSLSANAPGDADHLHLKDVVAPEMQSDVESALSKVMARPIQADFEPLSIEIPGDEIRTASLYIASLPRSNDQGACMVAHLIDTTEQKHLEMKYAHSQKMQAVGQLAGGIAHDFNNLLTAMIGFCDLLLMRHPAGDQSFADIMQIKQNANRAANLVRQLLAFSRRQTLQPKILDITDVLAELSDLIRRLIGENIELNMQHGRDLGMVKVDQGQLEQVIINLAVNARDAMSGGGTLSIRTQNLSIGPNYRFDRSMVRPADDDPIVPGDYVRIDVEDTGHGIPQDIIGKIFEPFFSTKEVGSGTGLGLATVYGIIKQTGGHIFVASSENGTTFTLIFKRFAPEESKAKDGNAEQAAETVESDLTGKNTILLVEDEAPVRIFSARALRNKGYTVKEADCGEAALEIMESEGDEVELIISDVIMPGIDGPSMIKEIWQARPNVEVIFISGYAEDALVKMEDSEKEYFFLPKPFTLKQLAEKVKEVTERID